jgi:hypothetical protein
MRLFLKTGDFNNAKGTCVDLPAPGGACNTTLLFSEMVAISSSITSNMGRDLRFIQEQKYYFYQPTRLTQDEKLGA